MDSRENNTKHRDAWCYECSCELGSDNPSHEHYRSRAHLNRLLQLGVELPVDDEQLPDTDTSEGIGWSDLPVESAKIAYCVVCETSIGNAAQAAAHYRSRDHLNRRLQRGLPVVELSSGQNAPNRDRFNQFLRRGVPLQQGSLGSHNGHAVAGMSPTPITSLKGGVNGKRKLPSASPGTSMMAKSPISPSTAMPIPSFVNEKRSRPQASEQKQSVGSSGRGFTQTRQATYVPNIGYSDTSGTAYWNATVTPLNNPYETSSFTSPYRSPSAPTSPYGSSTYRSQEYGSQAVGSYYGLRSNSTNQWNAQTTERQNVVYTEGWYCDLCHVPLPNALALNMHTMSPEHKIMEIRSSQSGQAQMTHWT